MIINKGGFIFFAKIDDQIVGTFALIKMCNKVYELGKMAVSPNFRGQQIGQQLMMHCLIFAKEKGWNKLTLYFSTKLKNALHIYKKFGFNEIPLENNTPYLRSDIKMELIL
ncbi:GNAT family N-acetyltransferase [Aquimarina sp. W85]|uniref:GNAT family N-acetyltransferase n=1 Tax=Aquimarina rhodophyticola TaxID=3342246 RepID=UPI0036715F02